jgi:hypothetical protein
MNERQIFLQDLLEKLDDVLLSIEEREVVEPDFAVVREYAEQLREEVQSLQE